MPRRQAQAILHGKKWQTLVGRLDFQGISELRKAGLARLKEARILFGNAAFRGAMYLAGYYLECLLKAKLIEMHRLRTIVELERQLGMLVTRHELASLMELTNRLEQLKANRSNWMAFNACTKWNTAWRYDSRPGTQAEAAGFLSAIERVGKFVEFSV